MQDDLASPQSNVLVRRDGHVVTVTIDRPESKNGCTGDMRGALVAYFERRPPEFNGR